MKTQGMPWPNVLADLEAKRDALVTIIDTIRTHFVGDTPGEMPDSTPVAHPRRGKKPAKVKKARAFVPDEVADKGAAILAMLKKHGGSLAPGALAKALKLGSTATLNYQLKPLVHAKQVVCTGVTAGRRVSLPGAVPKEAL